MKITESQMRAIIRKELEAVLAEGSKRDSFVLGVAAALGIGYMAALTKIQETPELAAKAREVAGDTLNTIRTTVGQEPVDFKK